MERIWWVGVGYEDSTVNNTENDERLMRDIVI